MRMGSWRSAGRIGIVFAALAPNAPAQNASPVLDVPKELQDRRTFVNTMRGQEALSPNDQANLREWIKAELAHLGTGLDPAAEDSTERLGAAFKAFRTAFQKQLSDPGNSAGFASQAVTQLAAVAVEKFPTEDLSVFEGIALSRALLDARTMETLSGVKAGLSSKYPAVRYLCAEGLKNLRTEILAANQLPDMVSALRAAGVKEDSDAVRQMIYRALAIPNRVGDVFDATLAILDARLDGLRKGGAKIGKDASVAMTYLVGESERLNPQQSEAAVRRAAVLLRISAEQYAAAAVRAFDDEVALELTLVQTEGLLEKLTRRSGGIRKTLEELGSAGKAKVLESAREWYGTSEKPGILSGDPWRVETGAP